jgi:hypothetical protein
MSILDKNWKYHDANETSKPGYLAKRFVEYRKRQEKDKPANVTPIAKRKQK